MGTTAVFVCQPHAVWSSSPDAGTGAAATVRVDIMASLHGWEVAELGLIASAEPLPLRAGFDPTDITTWTAEDLDLVDIEPLVAARVPRGPALVAWVDDSDYAYLCALGDGEVRARYLLADADFLAEIEDDEEFSELLGFVERCRHLHGADWRKVAVQALAEWSAAAPRPATADDLDAFFARANRAVFADQAVMALWALFGIADAEPLGEDDLLELDE